MFNKSLSAFLTLSLLLPGTALAAGKVGLWEATDSMNIPGMQPMTHTTTFCMTQKQVESDPLSARSDPRCTIENKSMSGHTFSADMVCGGGMKGHMTTTYDSDTHYSGSMTMTMERGTMEHKFEGRWVKADCAGAEHR